MWGAVPGRTDGSGARRCICEHVPVCVGKGLGPQGLEPSNLGKELKEEDRTRQVGMQVCAQICVVAFG